VFVIEKDAAALTTPTTSLPRGKIWGDYQLLFVSRQKTSRIRENDHVAPYGTDFSHVCDDIL
jgi:hypothetical protein